MWIILAEGLFFRLLLYSSLDTLSHAEGGPTHQVKGILGGSVSFPVNLSQGIKVEKIEWEFRPKNGGLGFRLSEYRLGKPEHPNPSDQFEQRLDMANQTMLRIKDLELNDSGKYRARVWFTKVLFQEQCFHFRVYEPVPPPQIHHQVESKTPDGCNVTSGREELNISWETGGPYRALEKSVNQCQVSDNGWELHVFSWNNSIDSKFTCLVSNPVDQKRASFDMLNICQSDGGQFGPSSWIPWLITALIVLVIMVMMVFIGWRKRCKGNERGVPSVRHESIPTIQFFCMEYYDDKEEQQQQTEAHVHAEWQHIKNRPMSVKSVPRLRIPRDAASTSTGVYKAPSFSLPDDGNSRDKKDE